MMLTETITTLTPIIETEELPSSIGRTRVEELEAAKQEAAERARIETKQRLAAQAAKEKADAEAKEAARMKMQLRASPVVEPLFG